MPCCYHSFACCHAKRAAHKLEVLHGNDAGLTLNLAETDLHGVFFAGFHLRVFEPFGIFLLIAEFEGIKRHVRHGDAVELAIIKQGGKAFRRADAHMMVAARAHLL